MVLTAMILAYATSQPQQTIMRLVRQNHNKIHKNSIKDVSQEITQMTQ